MRYPTKALRRILFLDIETAASYAQYEEMPEVMRRLWERKCRQRWKLPAQDASRDTQAQIAETYAQKAAIFAEFGKVVCVSVGFLESDEPDARFRVRHYASAEERDVLVALLELLTKYYNNPNRHFICGHNIREFDIPFLCRRMILHGLALPKILDIAGRKSWQVPQLLDTLEMWKFGDYKHYTSLEMLCAFFDIPTPKDGLCGAEVNTAFWDERLADIATYCDQDVVATARVYLRMCLLPGITDEQVVITSNEDAP